MKLRTKTKITDILKSNREKSMKQKSDSLRKIFVFIINVYLD